tara:strand:+ start:155 stop:478 length:324 start_codon:yes stop_codon:yes gene_type:complete
MVNNAAEEFSIANIFELEVREAKEKSVKGILVLNKLRNKILLLLPRICFKYLGINRKGRNNEPASKSLKPTKVIGPNSGVAIFINIKELPQIAPSKTNKNQYLICIF